MSLWHAGDLHMANASDMRLDAPRQIALDDLAVVEVHLHFQIVQAGRGAHRGTTGCLKRQVIPSPHMKLFVSSSTSQGQLCRS